jgi:hypothetical protein
MARRTGGDLKLVDFGPQPQFFRLVVDAEDDALSGGGVIAPRHSHVLAVGLSQSLNSAHGATPFPAQ